MRRAGVLAAVLCSSFWGLTEARGQTPGPQLRLTIDTPGARSGPFLGTATFTGWALDSAANLTGLTVMVDGAPIGSATYGASRPDVCAVYANPPGCPYVGWSFSLDTTLLLNGTHTLTVAGTSGAGNYATASATFVVANWTADAASTTRIFVDNPNAQSAALSGQTTLAGWAIDDADVITSVAITIDGTSFGNAVYGNARPDVCGVFPGRAGCPNVGWTFGLNTALLPDGMHTLIVLATTGSGRHYGVTQPFTVANNNASNPVRVWIDNPGAGSESLSGIIPIFGWAFDSNATIRKVAVAVDGISYNNASYGAARSDVCTMYPGKKGCPNVGWSGTFDTTLVADGAHLLEITATGTDGKVATASAPFAVSNAGASSPIKIYADVPGINGSTFIGSAVFSGWAIDTPASITSVALTIDGTAAGKASYGGSRPDVCAAYPGQSNCPNVGWRFPIDTTMLSTGTHTLAVTATASNGQHSTIGKTFRVANWAAGNPMRIFVDTPAGTAANQALSETAQLWGWAIDDEASMANVAILIDGVSYGMAAYGTARPDVCGVFPNRSGCPNVGWSFPLDTTQLSNGAHTLVVAGTSAGGQHATIATAFRIANPISLFIDQPNGIDSAFSGTVGFGGWAIDDNAAITSVAISFDGVPYGNAAYGVLRQDVCLAYPNRAGCPNVGWTFPLDTTLLVNGRHTMQVTATGADGQHATASRTFVVSQPGLSALAGTTGGRILEQATWGPNSAALQDLQSKGFDKWFAEQVAAPVSSFADQPRLTASGSTNTDVSPLQVQFFQNALANPDQLRQRIAFALSEIWVISEVELNDATAFAPLLRIFQNRAFDNYENLMKDVTLNAGMGRYLNMVNNDKGNASRGTAANENYARELMQLFTLGLTKLNEDGTPMLDGNNIPIPTYTQTDVTNLARVFTGWTYPVMPGAASKSHNPTYYLGSMVAVESNHDTTSKTVLGTVLPAGQTALQDLNQALHTIFLQPSLPPFISQQLIEHLVMSNPSPDYVGRVARVFEDNGAGVRGDLKAVVYAILSDPEARAGDNAGNDLSNTGHLREPVLFVLNLLRGLNGTLSSTTGVASTAGNLGQTLLSPPSVFSYFSPQYRTANGLLGPEFQIYSNQNAANRANTVNSAVYGGKLDAGTTFDLTSYIAAASDATKLINLINTVFFHQSMSSNLQGAILSAIAPFTTDIDRAKAALYVALTSGEYQVIH